MITTTDFRAYVTEIQNGYFPTEYVSEEWQIDLKGYMSPAVLIQHVPNPNWEWKVFIFFKNKKNKWWGLGNQTVKDLADNDRKLQLKIVWWRSAGRTPESSPEPTDS